MAAILGNVLSAVKTAANAVNKAEGNKTSSAPTDYDLVHKKRQDEGAMSPDSDGDDDGD